MKSLEELRAIREKMQGEVGARTEAEDGIRIVVGMGTCGIASGARPVLKTFVDEVQKRHLENVKVTQTGCIGLCRYEPIVEIYEPGKEKVTYIEMNPGKAVDVIDQHIIGGRVIEKYTLHLNEIDREASGKAE